MSPWALLGGVLLAVGALGGAYLQGRADGRDGEIATQAREDRAAAVATEAAASAAAAAIAKIEVTSEQIIQPIRREIRERVEYRDCVHTPVQLQRLNALITGAEQPAAAGSGVPAADGAR